MVRSLGCGYAKITKTPSLKTSSVLPPQRDLFEIPDDVCYLNCAYISPLLRSTVIAGTQGLERKSRPWEIRPTDFFSTAKEVRKLAAGLFGATPDDIAIVPSASYGLATAARNLPVKRGGNIVVLAEQYPSNFYIWERVAQESGAAIRTVARPVDGDWTSAVLEALDADTAIAALPQCHWSDGTLVDLNQVRQRLDLLGGALVLDLTQSLGAMTFELDQIRPDFAVAAAYKWLLGPYSTGLLYVDPRHHRGEPLELPIFSRKNAEAFSDIRYRTEFANGACRYDVGEVANFALLPALVNALTQITDWGVPAIESALAQRTNQIAHGAQLLGLDVTDSRFRAPHFVGIRFPDRPRPEVAEQLRAEKVYVGFRGDALRVTPHLYNTEQDFKRFYEVLRDSL